MRINNHTLISAISFYPAQPGEAAQLYLHLHPGVSFGDVNQFLNLSGATTADQPSYINEHKTIMRVDGDRNISLILLALKSWLTVEEQNKIDHDVMLLGYGATTSLLANASQYRVPVQAFQHLKPQDHVAVAFTIVKKDLTSVKPQDEKLFRVLLGANFKKQQNNIHALALKRDSVFASKLKLDFQLSVNNFQAQILDEQLQRSANQDDIYLKKADPIQFKKAFSQCIRDAKEMLIAEQILNRRDRPTIKDHSFESDVAYEAWLRSILDECMNNSSAFLRLVSDIEPEFIIAILTQKKVEDDDASLKLDRHIANFNAQIVPLVVLIDLIKKQHEQLIDEVVEDIASLPKVYQWRNEAEKKNLKEILSTTRIRIDSKDDKGNTLLHWAMETKNEVLSTLLYNAGANLDALNNDGKTPQQFGGLTKDSLGIHRAAVGAVITYISPTMLKSQEVLDRYQIRLEKMEADLKHIFFRFFRDEEIVHQRREFFDAIKRCLEEAMKIKEEEQFVSLLEQYCARGRSKRGALGKSSLLDPLRKIATEYREHPNENALVTLEHRSQVLQRVKQVEETVIAMGQMADAVSEEARAAQAENVKLRQELSSISGEMSQLKAAVAILLNKQNQNPVPPVNAAPGFFK